MQALLAFAMFLVFAGLQIAHAESCQNLKSFNGFTYKYSLCGIPDIDQRRLGGQWVLGLPNTGTMYCEPASVMDLYAYIANHGYPSLSPGAGDWGPEPCSIC